MNKYLVLYRSKAALNGMSVAEMMANTPPEQLAAGMAAWQAWHERAGSAVVDLGAPLDKSTAVEGDCGSPAKTSITGYSILEAPSLADAVALMQGHPHFHAPESSVQILECVPMPGM
jgi:hypothetical protein